MRAHKLKPHVITILAIPAAAFMGTAAAILQVYGKFFWHAFLHVL